MFIFNSYQLQCQAAQKPFTFGLKEERVDIWHMIEAIARHLEYALQLSNGQYHEQKVTSGSSL